MNKSGIYCIKNTINNKMYIGSAVDINTRISGHKRQLRQGKHHSRVLQRSWNKHGEKSFVFIRMEQVQDKKQLIQREQFWIDLIDAANRDKGYNINPTAGSALGTRVSEETRAKISKAHTGSKWSDAMRRKMVGRKQPLTAIAITSAKNRGRKHTPETIAKMSAARKGKINSPETRAKIAARAIGQETREKLRKAQTGKKASPETRTKLSNKMIGNKRLLGHKHTQETRQKMSIIRTGKTQTEATKRKRSESAKQRASEQATKKEE